MPVHDTYREAKSNGAHGMRKVWLYNGEHKYTANLKMSGNSTLKHTTLIPVWTVS